MAGSNDGLWDWDILTNEMFLSERAQRIYGLEPGRTIRPRAEWRALVKIHPDDAEGQLRNVEDYLAGKSANYEGEWRVLHPDGRYRWIRIRGTCVRDAEGRPTRFAGSVSDIDVRRRAEEALRRSESYLAEALRLGRAGSFAYDARAAPAGALVADDLRDLGFRSCRWPARAGRSLSARPPGRRRARQGSARKGDERESGL